MGSPRRILNERGLKALKSRGQNFLSDPNQARAIVRSTGLGEGDSVLEIGPGLGALTVPLLEAGVNVVAVEVDRGLAQYLTEEVAPLFPDRMTLINEDILSVGLDDIADRFGSKFSIVGNLPYIISSELLLKMLDGRRVIHKATVMFQKELADRLAASPGNRDYGRLSVLTGYYTNVRRVMHVGPESFFPRPKVGSSVIEIEFKNDPEPELLSDEKFRQVIAASFAKRRKTIKNSLRSFFSQQDVDQMLEKAGIDPGRRAETLSVEEFVMLSNILCAL